MNYDFLQVTDEMLDEVAPALADALTALGRKTVPGEALSIIIRLERSVIRRVPESATDLRAALRAQSLLPVDKASLLVARAAGWPPDKGRLLIEALSDETVSVLEPEDDGWRVRDMEARYGRYMVGKKSARQRSRNNYRAREAGWLPSGDGRTWQHPAQPDQSLTLDAVVALLDRETEP